MPPSRVPLRCRQSGAGPTCWACLTRRSTTCLSANLTPPRRIGDSHVRHLIPFKAQHILRHLRLLFWSSRRWHLHAPRSAVASITQSATIRVKRLSPFTIISLLIALKNSSFTITFNTYTTHGKKITHGDGRRRPWLLYRSGTPQGGWN